MFCLKVSWAADRWGAKFFTNTLPMFAVNQMLVNGGRVWLPRNAFTVSFITEYESTLSEYYTIRAVGIADADENELYRATTLSDSYLAECPEAYTNGTQMKYLLAYSDEPFYALYIRPAYARRPHTPPAASPVQENTYDSDTGILPIMCAY